MLDLGGHGLPKTEATLLRLKLLGRMEATSLSGESVLPIGSKTRGLLAILAMSDRKPVLRSRLSELLWSRRPEDLARASLRQEIHRLSDALSPLGVDVIDVQRHALALKPALTSVDAERVLTATARSLHQAPPVSDTLLNELNGIDPAFDVWLNEQRERLSRHIQAVIESILREQTDPDAILDAAERLLRIDDLNEAGWRARLQAAMQRGDYNQGLATAEQCLLAFETRANRKPGQETMSLIDALRRGRSDPDTVQYPTQPKTQPVAPTVDLMLAGAPLVPARGQQATRRVASLFVVPMTVQDDVAGNTALAREMFDTLDISLVKLNTFNILTPPDGELAPELRDPNAMRQRLGADYALSGVLRAPGPRAGDDRTMARLVIRVVDLRQGIGTGSTGIGSIVWAARHDVPEDVNEREALVARIASEVEWALFLLEARRVAHRPAKDLSALGLSLRATLFLLRRDRSAMGEAAALLERAEELDRDQPLIWFAKGILYILRAFEEWDQDYVALIQQAVEAAQICVGYLPESPLGNLLLARALTLLPGNLPRARAIVEEYRAYAIGGQTSLVGSVLGDTTLILQGLLEGDKAGALARLDMFNAMRTGHPLNTLADPVCLLTDLLCGRTEGALVLGRSLTGLYPRQSLSLIYCLAALSDGGDEKEIAVLRDQLERLQPGITVAQIVAHHPHLTAGDLKMLEAKLKKAGLRAG